jgi:hypothetical protein
MKIIEAQEVVAGIIVAVNFLQKMKGRHQSRFRRLSKRKALVVGEQTAAASIVVWVTSKGRETP